MDTPQVTAAMLDEALVALDTADAALGYAVDGGWWAIALRRADARAFPGVPMSRRVRERSNRLAFAGSVCGWPCCPPSATRTPSATSLR